MAQAGTLHDAFIEELRDTYDAEKQLIKALPKLAKAAASDDLRAAFETHLEETRGHVERLEQTLDVWVGAVELVEPQSASDVGVSARELAAHPANVA